MDLKAKARYISESPKAENVEIPCYEAESMSGKYVS